MVNHGLLCSLQFGQSRIPPCLKGSSHETIVRVNAQKLARGLRHFILQTLKMLGMRMSHLIDRFLFRRDGAAVDI